MSDNKLLSENTIRRFMKLANTEALSNNFLAEEEKYGRDEMEARAKKAREAAKKKGEKGSVAGKGVASMIKQEQQEEEDTLEETEEFDLEGLEEQEDDLMADEEPEEEMDMPEDPMADEGPGDEDEPVGAADMSLTEEEARILVSLGERLAGALGGAEDELDMGDEDMAEEPPMDDAADLEGPEDPEEDEAAMGGYAMRGAMEESTQNEIVQEVLKRVTKRLVSQKLRK